MNVALAKSWTPETFLSWAAAQDGRYEFDGVRPVAMTGGTARHSRVTGNIHAALRTRLRGTPCACYGPDLAIRTAGDKIRSPDALVTCTKFPDTDLLAPDPVVVFEVLSPTSGRTDRIDKVRDYLSVPSIRRYVIVETRFAGLLVLHRHSAADAWTALPLTGDESLPLPELSLTVPISEFYEDVEFT